VSGAVGTVSHIEAIIVSVERAAPRLQFDYNQDHLVRNTSTIHQTIGLLAEATCATITDTVYPSIHPHHGGQGSYPAPRGHDARNRRLQYPSYQISSAHSTLLLVTQSLTRS